MLRQDLGARIVNGVGVGERQLKYWSIATMPFKHNAARRHHIGKMKFKVTNWAEYEAGLRRRGSLTLWMTAEALSSWQAPKRTTRGGQPRYSDQAARPLHFNGRTDPRPH